MPEDFLIIDDKDRYSRLRLIPWWDQDKLRKSKFMVVGAGALGNEVLKNLALIGIGEILLIDYDEVENTNLSRSVLYSASDEGQPKVNVAKKSVQKINPEVRVRSINCDVMELGLGFFKEVDIVIGCLDNREARLWVNRQCWRLNIPWVDAAIQELSAVVKVFVPPDSACYECAMTEMDYKLINIKYSCPLLKREDIIEGKVPTTPTSASIAAALQTQEALKIIHGLEVKAGCAIVFNGISNTFYITELPRKKECLSHEFYDSIVGVPLSAETSFLDFFREMKNIMEADKMSVILDREMVLDLECKACARKSQILRPKSRLSFKDSICKDCSQPMIVNMSHQIESTDSLFKEKKLTDAGIPYYDIVKVKTAGGTRYVLLGADRSRLETF